MNVLRRSVRVRAAERLRRSFTHLIALVVAVVVAMPVLVAATASPAAGAAADDGVLKVLLFYKPNFHASHVQARQAVNQLSAELGTQYGQRVEIQETENPDGFNTGNLATVDVVAFAQTGGVLFNLEQRAALEAYIRGGGGYVGMHYAGWSVGQSEHDVNPFYARLVGAASEGHPENPAVRPGRIVVKDVASPLTQGLPAELNRSDEWYDWILNPAPNVRTLVEADESSYGMGRQGSSHPITWCQEIDDGRSWYTGMGHEGTAYSEPYIRTQLRHGLAYAAGLLPADCSPPSKAENGAWSGVTPWPLMPINMALTSDGTVQSFGSIGGGGDPTPYDFTGNSSITQGGQMEVDVWDPAQPRTLANLRSGILPNTTYTDLFCSMQVQNPHNHSTMTVGGDDGLGGNAPNDAALGVTSYSTNNGLQNEAPMNYPRWYPTGTTMPNGDIVVQGGSLRGGPGGPGVLTPEIYTPDTGSGWELLPGATSALAYGDGGGGNGPDENRWWYPRAFVAPGSGNLFNISGTQMFELDPSGNGGTGALTPRGTLGAGTGNQGGLGNPVGATSTATMYRPGKILQVGGGWWGNGGGPAGARAGLTVDITGGTADPVVEATEPMQFQRHWATSTVLPDGDVLVTGGSRDNNENGGYVTNAEVWDPDSGEWTTLEAPYEHARLYHSAALLLPDGRVMIGGGGAPGPRNYTDVEYYSPSYLFDGDVPAQRPVVTGAPDKIGYDATFQVSTASTVSRVTLVRNGSVTHGFNNDQNFQDLDFTASAGGVSVTAPEDGTYAPPGSYMVFVFDEDGVPSVASMLDIDPEVELDSRTPQVVEQFEYPRFAAGATVVDVPADGGRMAPWSVERRVQLVRGTDGSQGGLGLVGYHVGLGANGAMSRELDGLDVGRDYRVSLRHARDSRAAGTTPGSATLAVGDLSATLSSTRASNGDALTSPFETYVGTFTASERSETLTLAGPGSGAGLMVDNLVVIGVDPGAGDVPVHYEFEETSGASAANTGTDTSVGAATLTGTTGRSDDGVFGRALDLPGGSNANAVDLPDNLLQGEADFTTSFWVRPDAKANWIGMFHLGDGLGDAGSFFQIQMQTQAAGNTGLAATFKAKGSPVQERVFAAPTKDVVANRWNHVAFTRTGATGTLYLDGVEIARRDDLTIDMTDVGPTSNNWLGRNGFPDPALDAQLDDVRLYTSTLSADDIASLYADGSALRTTTTVSVDPVSPSPFAEPLSVSTSVDGDGDEPATGTVQLVVDGEPAGAPVELVDGAATFPEVTLSPGAHDLEVRYTAAEGFRDSVGTVTHTVERPPPGSGVPIRYAFDEGTGTTAANSGLDTSVGPATLTGATGWSTQGQFGAAVSLPGGAAATGNQVELPDNLTSGMDTAFSASMWLRPDALPNWVSHLQIGKNTEEFFLVQSSTENGARGFAATLRADNGVQHRIQLPGETDVPLNDWTHVVVTLGPSTAGGGTTGKVYFDGTLMPGGTVDNIPVDIGDIGAGGTTANFLGGTSWPDPRYDGLIDEVQLFGYELTAEQVMDLTEGPDETNAAPVAVGDAYGTDEGVALTVAAPGVLGNDTDADSDALTATGVTQPADGGVTLNANGSFTYTPDAGFSGTDTFTYRADDGTVESAPATVTITVAEGDVPPVNAAPVAVGEAYDTDEGVALTVAAPGVLGNDTDADSDPLTATGVTEPAHGEVTMSAAGRFTYVPDAGFSGIDTFTYRASDSKAVSAPATVTITVEDANAAPTTVDDAYRTDEGVTLTVAAPGVLGNDTDADGDPMAASVLTQPASGEVTLTASGRFSYVPDAGFAGNDTFTYAANDGSVDSAPATVTITVVRLAEAPVAVNDAYRTDEGETLTVSAPGVLGNDTDADDDPLTATGATQPADGELTFGADGSFTYTPDAGFSGTDTFTYRANDGALDSAPVTVTITVDDRAETPEATEISGRAASFAYGRSGVVVATLTPSSAAGRVEVLDGSRVLGSGVLRQGEARIALKAKSLRPGTYRLALRYAGNASHEASMTTVLVTVRKLRPSMKVQAPDRVQRGDRATIRVTLSAPGNVPMTGTVRATIRGGTTVAGPVRAGRVTLRLPPARAGALRVEVVYLGSELATRVVKNLTMTVRRR